MSKLSFSLPKYNSAMSRFVREVKTGLEQLDPILSQIKTSPIVHAGMTRQVSQPKKLDTEMKKHSVEIVVQLEWIRKTNAEQFTNFLYNTCQSFNSLSKKLLFEIISKTTEATGNIYNAQGRNLWDAQIESMEKCEIRFDEYGNHGYQSIVSPEIGRQLEENPMSPEQEKRWEELMNAKRAEYYAKKRTRRLS